jgi:hypothetical protein
MVTILTARIAAKRESGETAVADVVGQLMAGKGVVVLHDQVEAAPPPSRTPDGCASCNVKASV